MSAKARLVPLARQAVKAGAGAGDVLLSRSPGITILIYHRVGAGTGGEMDLEPSVFDEQLAWLREHHRVLTLDQAADELAGSGGVSATPQPTRNWSLERARSTSERPVSSDGSAGAASRSGVVLTFDDGTTDWVEHVLPALERAGVPATFYVATDFVERQVAFPGDGTPLTWAALSELASSDLVTVGSHTHRHLLLDRLGPSEIDEELDRSVELLHERAGVDPTHFCYPKAVAGSPAAEAAIRQRFRTAVLGGTRPNLPGADLHRLHRSPVQRSDGMSWFRRKSRGGMRLEDDLRRGANRVRYRGKTS